MHGSGVQFFIFFCRYSCFYQVCLFLIQFFDCLTQSLKTFFTVSYCCNSERIIFGLHFHLNMVAVKKDMIQVTS